MEEFSTFGEHFLIKSILKRMLSPLLIISLIRGECVRKCFNAYECLAKLHVEASDALNKAIEKVPATNFNPLPDEESQAPAIKRICTAPHPIIEPPTTFTASPPVVTSGIPDL